MPITDEAQAIQLCQQGDDAGLVFLIAQHQRAALRLAYMLIGDLAAAEDTVQESFLRAFRDIRSFHNGRPFVPWLLRIVTNQSRTYQRGSRHYREISLNVVLDAGAEDSMPLDVLISSSIADPALQAEHQEERAAMGEALTSLTQKQREAVVLRYYFGYSDKEIAVIMDCRPDAARQRLHDGLRSLEKIIIQKYPWLIQPQDSAGNADEGKHYDTVRS